MKKTILAAALLLAGGLAFSPQAQASYVVTLTQVGSNVVATGSGSINLTGLSFLHSPAVAALLDPAAAQISLGPVSGARADMYARLVGPTSFGLSGFFIYASSGSGDFVGIEGDSGALFVPAGYVSGSSLSSTSTYDNSTFASRGVTPGSYVWTWGSGADADSFTLNIGTPAVPEPGSLLLLGIALIGLLAVGRRRPA